MVVDHLKEEGSKYHINLEYILGSNLKTHEAEFRYYLTSIIFGNRVDRFYMR